MDFKNKEDMALFVKNKAAEKGFSLKEEKQIDYGVQLVFMASSQKDVLRIYQSKKGVKLDLSQTKSEELKNLFGTVGSFPSKSKEKKEMNFAEIAYPFCGSDEAGKGDFFGPLCVSCVLLDEDGAKKLEALGVKDSKKISDTKIVSLAEEIKKTALSYSVMFISPSKLNELHQKGRNMNAILAFLHSCAIKEVVKESGIKRVVVDQFATETYMQGALKEEMLSLYQTPKAEVYTPVAAASILARNKFVEEIGKQGSAYDVAFPLGAGEKVIVAMRAFVKKYSSQDLDKVAKTFFKTTDSL